MIDVVTVGAGGGSIAWLSPEGTLKVGPQSAGADPGPLCYGQRRHRADRSPTRTCCSAGSRRTCSAARSRSTSTPRRAGVDALAGAARARPGGAARPASWRSPPGTRPTRCARSPSSAASTSATSRWRRSAAPARCCCAGWSTSSGCRPCWCRPNPGNVSAFGLLTVDVRNDYVQTAVALGRRARPAGVAGGVRRPGRPGRATALDARGLRRAEHVLVRTADLRYFGQAYEVRVPVPDGPVDRGRARRGRRAFHDAHRGALRLRLPPATPARRWSG